MSLNYSLAPIFDLGGVIFDFDFSRFIDAVLPHGPAGLTRETLSCLAESRHEKLERGLISFPEFYENFASAAGLQIPLDAFQHAWNDIFTPKEEMVKLIKRLSGTRKYLLSNTDASHIAWINSRFPGVLGLFDACFYSYELGVVKPAPAAFRKVEAASGLSPRRHLLIDDIELNITAAKNAGWQALLFQNAATLANELKKLGIQIE